MNGKAKIKSRNQSPSAPGEGMSPPRVLGVETLSGVGFSRRPQFSKIFRMWVSQSVIPAQAGIQALSPVSCGIAGFPPSRE
jgi:hypothetical protein